MPTAVNVRNEHATLADALAPCGLLPNDSLAELRAFGAEAERLEYPSVDVGGFIIPGNGPAHPLGPGKEYSAHGTERTTEQSAGRAASAQQEARSAAGPRQGSPAAATRPTAHAVRSRLGLPAWLQLDELDGIHPEARMLSSSSSYAVIEVPVGLFRTLPYRARLTLEIPLSERARLTRPLLPALPSTFEQPQGMPNTSPDVRAWAIWVGNGRCGQPITSDHQMPDGCICACMPGQWVRGVHPLADYIGYCISWIGKVLHERELGFWPGPQHLVPAARMRRDRPDEFCGCTRLKRYRDCCMADDHAMSSFARWADRYAGRQRYLEELRWQGRAPRAPGL